MPGTLMAQPVAPSDKITSPITNKVAQQRPTFSQDGGLGSGGAMDVAPKNSPAAAAPQHSTPNGIIKDSALGKTSTNTPTLKKLPPEIEHVTLGFKPLSQLFTRIAQESFNSLNELITALSEVPDAPQANGVLAPSEASANANASVQRRLRWLQWAHTERRKFMKVLVIVQWSRRAQDVRSLIDVNHWINTQDQAITNAWFGLGNVRLGVLSTIVPGPDIATALEVLQGEEQRHLPSFDYLPLDPLPPSKLLETIRNLNALLHIRLNLHEQLPSYLQDYAIHDGKVTFVAPHEFEVDLIIADEDPSSQFWFVDFRLLFSSVGDIPAGSLGASIEQRVNSALSTHGLVGCFEVLHEFCLTMKVSVLRQQALALGRAAWAGSLKVDQLNRAVVVQYWCDRPGKKSWIQIGAKRGKPIPYQPECRYWPSTLNVKWMMDGKESPVPASLDLGTTTVEQLLKRVIAQHVTARLASVKQSIERSSKALAIASYPILSKSELEPSDCSLHLSPHSKQSMAILVESISGKFVLQPATPVASLFEHRLNDAEMSGSSVSLVIEQWLASDTMRKLTSHVKSGGWSVEDVPGADRDYLKRRFGMQTTELMFVRKEHWKPSNWYIAFVTHPTFETAWVARLAIHNNTTQVREKYSLDSIKLSPVLKGSPDWTQDLLEQTAVTTITRHVFQRRLKRAQIALTTHTASNDPIQAHARMTFDISPLIHRNTSSHKAGSPVLDHSDIALLLTGFKARNDKAQRLTFVAKGRLQKSIVESGVLNNVHDSGISFNPAGHFSLVIESSLGSVEPIDRLAFSISALEQLGMMMKSLRQHKLQCLTARLDYITFRYAGEETIARVSFHGNGRLALEDLEPSSNPQKCILKRLNAMGRSSHSSPSQSFDVLLRTLIFTLPLLRALDGLQQRHPKGPPVRIYTHGLIKVIINYVKLQALLNVEFTAHRGQACWTVEMESGRQGTGQTHHLQAFQDAFKTLCSQEGEGWTGHRTGIVASPHAVGDIVDKIHATATAAIENEKSDPASDADRPRAQPQPPQVGPNAGHRRSTPGPSRGGNQNAEIVVID